MIATCVDDNKINPHNKDEMAAATALAASNPEKFQALMDTIQSVAPGIVEAIIEGLKGF